MCSKYANHYRSIIIIIGLDLINGHKILMLIMNKMFIWVVKFMWQMAMDKIWI